MLKEAEAIIIKNVSSNFPLKTLIEKGYTYSQMALIIEELEKRGYLGRNDGCISLTQEGKDALFEYQKRQKVFSSSSWILPQKQNYIEKISVNEIFLPKSL